MTVNCFSENISGIVVDGSNGKPLDGVLVALMEDSTIFIGQTLTGKDGRFKFSDVKNADVAIRISSVGYELCQIELSGDSDNINLGEISLEVKSKKLEEVEIVRSRVIETSDHYVILPSLQELERASQSFNLLAELKMKMPGLNVNEALNKVTIGGGTPVFQINGKEESLSKIRAINPKNIQKIEYTNNPSIRYADRGFSGIINFILKQRQEGGSVRVETNNALSTLRSNSLVAGSYVYKKSEWMLAYNNIWRNSKKQYTNQNEKYIGKDYPIERKQIGNPS